MKNKMFIRRKFSLLLILLITLLVGVATTGCSTQKVEAESNTTEAATADAAGSVVEEKAAIVPELTLSLNHIGSTNHPYHFGSEFLKEKLLEFSNGRMSIDIYPASQIAAGAKAISAVQMGTLDIAVENPMSLGNFVPEAEVLNLPYLFDDHEQAFRLMDGEVGKKFEEASEAKGLKVIGWWYNGYRNMSNSKRPIKTPEDVKGLKMRIAESEIFSATFEAFGAFPVVMPTSEIFTALQMGTVDAQENPQNNYLNNKYYEVNKYYSFTKHVFTVEPLVMSLDRFNELTAEQQEILIKAVDASEIFQRQIAKETEDTQLQQVVDDPTKDVEVTVIEDLSGFRAIVAPVYDLLRPTLGEYIELVEKAKAEEK
jgi:tripartite ATP-independent transporter DctP family solute receptor